MLKYIILYFIMTYGASNILVYGGGPFGIIGKFRNFMGGIASTFGDMLSCMMCTSANVGWIVSLMDYFFLNGISITPMNILYGNAGYWYVVVFGDLFLTSGAVWLIHTLQEMIERIGIFQEENEGEA